MKYALTDEEIINSLLTNNKDKFIKAIDWENTEIPLYVDGALVDGGYKTRRLEDVLNFFHTHTNLENKIDWNERDHLKLATAIDKLITDTLLKAEEKEQQKKVAKSVDWESHGCKVWYEDANYILVSPLSWESAKFMDSDECGGAGATWCIGWQDDDRYWRHYVMDNKERFVMVFNKHPTNIYNDLKVMIEFIDDKSYKIWEQVDTTIGFNQYGSTDCFIEERYGTKYSDFASLLVNEAIPKAFEVLPSVVESFNELNVGRYEPFFESLIDDGVELTDDEVRRYCSYDYPIEMYVENWLDKTNILTQIRDAWVENGLFKRIDGWLYLVRGTKISDRNVLNNLNIPSTLQTFMKSQVIESLEYINDYVERGRSRGVDYNKAFIVKFKDDDRVSNGYVCDVYFTFDSESKQVFTDRTEAFFLNIRRRFFWFDETDTLFWKEYNLSDVIPQLMDTPWSIINKHVDLNKYISVAQGSTEPKTIKLKGTFGNE